MVAQEVRALAQRSANAAREIGGIVGDATREIERGASLSGTVVAAMEGIESAVDRSHSLAGHLRALAEEQAAGIRTVGDALAELGQTGARRTARWWTPWHSTPTGSTRKPPRWNLTCRASSSSSPATLHRSNVTPLLKFPVFAVVNKRMLILPGSRPG